MPIHTMSLFQMPSMVQFKLEKIQRDFLWGGGNLTRKIHLVKWSTVCTSKGKGGLSIRNVSNLNRALLGKWVWRFALEVNSTWREFINLKYGTGDGNWFTQVPRGSYGVALWKEINKETEQLKHNCSFKIGDESIIKF